MVQVGADDHGVGVDAGRARGFHVAADGVDVLAEAHLREQDPRDDQEGHQEEHLVGHDAHELVLADLHDVARLLDDLALGVHQRQAARGGVDGQSHDERGGVHERDDQRGAAIEHHAQQDAGQYGHQRGGDIAPAGGLREALERAQHEAAAQRDHRAGGQVRVAGDDQKRDAAGDDADRRVLPEQIQYVGQGQEVVVHDLADDDEDQQDQEDADFIVDVDKR